MTKSRTVLAIIAPLLAQPAVAGQPSGWAEYRRLTTVSPQCRQAARATDIVVCSRRTADRWRVPFIGYEAGDPRGESVMAERERLSADPPLPCGVGAFLANCGSVGIRTSTRFGASGSSMRLRSLAP